MKKLLLFLALAAAGLQGWAEEYYLVGGCTDSGWSAGEWERSAVRAYTADGKTWVWAGKLTTGEGDAGRFKIPNGTSVWYAGYWAPSQGTVLTSEWSGMDDNGDSNDYKWCVSEEGYYLITFKTDTKQIKAEKLTAPSKDGDYYLINSVSDYYYFAAYIATDDTKNAKARLIADLNFSGYTFTPMASDKHKFCGEFDGNGHTIDYAKVVSTSFGKIGLFTYVTGGANIHDLIMGENCRFEGTVKTGGISGYARDGGTVTLTNVINKAAAVSTGGSTGNEGNSAGFIACATDKTIITATNCGNMGLVSGQDEQCAAFAGWTQDNEKTGDDLVKTTFTNCWNSGTIYNTQGSDQLYRNTDKVTATNCYDASASANRGQGTLLNTKAVASGELGFMLKAAKSSGEDWYQTIGSDAHPFPFSSHGVLPSLTPTDGWYEISEPWQLCWMAVSVNEKNTTYRNANIKLTADIDYSDYTDQAAMFGKPSNTYKGTFDGQCHTVTVAFSNTTAEESGLFRRINGGTVKNLKVTGTIATNQKLAGGVCSGIWQRGTITNCESAVTITDDRDGEGTHGGILACSHDEVDINVKNCLFSGTLNASKCTGNAGIVGWTNNSSNVKVKNCLVTGTLTIADSEENGVIVRSTATTESNYYTCSVGSNVKKDVGTEASAKKGTGELCYLLNESTVAGNGWYQTLAGTDSNPIPLSNHKSVYQISSSSYTNLPVDDGKVQISKADDLMTFSAEVNYYTANKSTNAELTNDIDMDGISDYTPVGKDPSNKYAGTFDGKGFRIKNLKIDTDTKEQGLFSVCENATIQNLIMDASCSIRCTNTNNYGSAAFVAVCNGSGTLSFINCGNEASVYGGKSNNAAFLGFNHSNGGLSVSLTNCYNTGAVSGGYDDCAMIGWNAGNAYTMTNCYNTGTISNTNSDGNTWGRSSGDKTLDNCYTTQSCSDITNLTASYSSDKVKSGELCVALGAAFTQDLSQANSYPTFGSEAVGRGQWFSDDYIYYNIDESDNITVNELNLNENNTKYEVPAKVTAKSVTLTRTLHELTADGTQRRWNTFCSPVAIAKSNFSAAKELTDVTDNGDNYSMTFTDVEGDVLEAGKPYMVQVSAGKSSLTASNVAVAETVTPVTINGLTYTGNFTNCNAPMGSFIISDNVFYNVDRTVALKAFRGYITVDSGSSVKALTFDFEDEEDGINSLTPALSEGEGAIYNVAGQRISKMQKGINIVNGRKVLF